MSKLAKQWLPVLAVVFTIGLVLVGSANAAHSNPITLEQIEYLLEEQVSPDDVADQIDTRGVEPFVFNDSVKRRIEDAGGSDLLLFVLVMKLGQAWKAESKYEEAEGCFLLAHKWRPNVMLPLLNLAFLYGDVGQYQAVLAQVEKLLELDKSYAPAYFLRYDVSLALGNYNQAFADAEFLVKAYPDHYFGFFALAQLRAASPVDSMRDGASAVELAKQGLSLLDKQSKEAWNLLRVLAAALAETGDFASAIEIQKNSLEIAPEPAAPFCRSLLESYQQKQPFRLSASPNQETPNRSHPNKAKPNKAKPNQGSQRPEQPAEPTFRDRLRMNLSELLSSDMVQIKGGSFQMGAQRNNPEFADEGPVHEVTVEPFWISKYEVTNRLWALVMDGHLGDVPNPDQPVESVSYADCQEFIRRVNSIIGADVYRLPTEAEWEFMARAGSQTDFYFGDSVEDLSDYGWYLENSAAGAHPVGTLTPNELGVFDVHGNVAEWCESRFASYPFEESETQPPSPDESFLAVVRGGGWSNSASYCRVSARGVASSRERRRGIGFRLAANQSQSNKSSSSSNRLSGTELDSLISELEKAIAEQPENGQVLVRYASALIERGTQRYKAGEFAASVEDLQRALERLPRHHSDLAVYACMLLAWTYATCPDDSIRDFEKAIANAEIACGVTHWERWEPIHILAAVYAEAGRFEKAIDRENQAEAIAPPEMKQYCRENRQLFDSGEPVRTKRFWNQRGEG